MEWKREDDLRCPGCGQPLDESTDDETRAAWAAEVRTCHSCGCQSRVSKGAGPGALIRTYNRAKAPS